MTDNLRGALFMMASMATFTLNDACLKWLAGALPTFQVVLLRGLLVCALIAALAHATGALRMPIPPADRRPVALRSALEVAAFLPFVVALTRVPLSTITAILQAAPLFITAAGALFLGEQVGWRRWTAIAVGLAGVLLIVRPGVEGFDAWALLPLLTVALITARDLVTRRITRGTPSLKVAIFTAAGVTALGAALSARETWAPLDAGQGAVLALAAVFILGGYLFSILAMRVGEIAAVTPFRYTAMVWGLLLGVVLFAERPDPVMLLGAAMVVGTGLYTLWREGRAVPVPRPVAPR
ncbi:DMT family transporter [Jannaschia sp. W003]|uniref:DMT family transporter n=1 Tax=Jannaschia sp. W003 TaxID=2867012 RepID=UPI0021A768E4|nr:DMT family transporter [Jannaschia sp. W003]UWQ20881.1 DMT family transporter [Jannaschia sp. W003]